MKKEEIGKGRRNPIYNFSNTNISSGKKNFWSMNINEEKTNAILRPTKDKR